MAQPRQLRNLARSRRGKHTPRKMLVEEALPPLSIRALLDLKLFPSQRNQRAYNPYDGRRWPYIEYLMVSNRDIKVRFVGGSTQIVGVHLHDTGPGQIGDIWHRQRFLVCPHCGEHRRRLYFRTELGPLLACVRCQKLSYASRQCCSGNRPGLQLQRKETQLRHGRMWGKTRRKLEAEARELRLRRPGLSQRFSGLRFQAPLKWALN